MKRLLVRSLVICGLSLGLVVGYGILQNRLPGFTAPANAQVSIRQIQKKAQRVGPLIKKRAQQGEGIGRYMDRMETVKQRIKAGDRVGAMKLLDEVLAELEAPTASSGAVQASSGPSAGGFGRPQRVKIRNYDSSLGTMEPFITRDGRFLFFNSASDAFGVDQKQSDLHYARRDSDGQFTYVGPVEGANSKAFDGAVSMDENNRLYFSTIRSYKRDQQVIYASKFSNGAVRDVGPVRGEVSKRKPGLLNMDGEISADGRTLYFSDNKWDVKLKIPGSSNLVVAKLEGGMFRRNNRSSEIFRNINTNDLEYAPATSPDQLTLFFTRARFRTRDGKLVGADFSILMATRKSRDDIFGQPQKISTITGFVEGPSITTDGKELYFHRKDGKIYRIYKVVR